MLTQGMTWSLKVWPTLPSLFLDKYDKLKYFNIYIYYFLRKSFKVLLKNIQYLFPLPENNFMICTFSTYHDQSIVNPSKNFNGKLVVHLETK